MGWGEEVELLCSISSLAVLGVLFRCLLHWALQGVMAGNSASYADVAANAVGCLVMGAAVQFEARAPLRSAWAVWAAAVTKGFCGSLTSFSAWMVATCTAWLTVSSCPEASNVSYAVFWGLYQLVSSWSLCFAFYQLGVHSGHSFIPVLLPATAPGHVGSVALESSSSWRVAVCFVACLLSVGLAVGLTAGLPLFTVAPSLLFAAPGALLRVYLSSSFNAPWGTVAANAVGTAMAALAVWLWRAAGQQGSVAVAYVGTWMAAFAGAVSFGLAGALSTVSTLMKEFVSMPAWPALLYVLGTVVGGQCIAFAVLTPLYY